jgi:hypothetical protein
MDMQAGIVGTIPNATHLYGGLYQSPPRFSSARRGAYRFETPVKCVFRQRSDKDYRLTMLADCCAYGPLPPCL